MDDNGRSSRGGSGASSSSSGTAGSTGPIVEATSGTGADSSTGSLETSGGPFRTCSASGYPNVDFCFGTANSVAECTCDGECQWQAVAHAGETFPNPGCGFVYNQTLCTELWDGQCCYTANLFDDICGKGRPLMVDEHAKVASLVPGDGWGQQSAAQARPDVAAYWLDVGLEEHASVASFARFALELVSVGAPANLLGDTATAMRDEVRHAELAFALAGRFGAEALQPGPLHAGSSRSTSLEDVVVATVHEGCIGETLAAAHAELAAQRASDPSVVAALKEIAADEAEHAALAWRVVQWALRVDPSLSRAIARAFATSSALDVATKETPPVGCEAYGILGAQDVEHIRAVTLRETVRPFAEALLSSGLQSSAAAEIRS